MAIRKGIKHAPLDELEMLAGTESPADALLEKELMQALEAEIQALPKKCRQILLLSRSEGLSNKEIATHLGLSIKTVENQMTIALRRLRKGLGDFLWVVLLFFKML